MIAEVIPSAYDAEGKKVFRPFDRRRGPRPSFPLGRYVSHPLAVHCQSVEEVREFLKGCRYVSDKELFDKEDYWQPPEGFEQLKKGDCEDFAFWTWRQFMGLGFNTGVVFGRHGRYGSGHAWVQFIQDGKCFLVEPQYRYRGNSFSRLGTLRYRPRFSVAWDGDKLSYYQHREYSSGLSAADVVGLIPEYVFLGARFWLFVLVRMIPRAIWVLLKRFLKKIRWRKKPRPS
jgi:hypothetical protein